MADKTPSSPNVLQIWKIASTEIQVACSDQYSSGQITLSRQGTSKDTFKFVVLLVIYHCWSGGLLLNAVYFPSANPLRKLKFLITIGYKLGIASALGVKTVSNPGRFRAASATDSCRPCSCAQCLHLCEFISIGILLVQRALYPWVPSSLLDITLIP